MAEAARSIVEEADRRIAARLVLGRRGTIRLDTGEAIEVVVTDLNRDGCRIETDAVLAPDTVFSIGLAHVGHSRARVVWHGTNGYGCEFAAPLSPGDVTAAFGASNVAPFPRDMAQPARSIAAKWSPRARLAFVVISVAVTWSALGLTAAAIF